MQHVLRKRQQEAEKKEKEETGDVSAGKFKLAIDLTQEGTDQITVEKVHFQFYKRMVRNFGNRQRKSTKILKAERPNIHRR